MQEWIKIKKGHGSEAKTTFRSSPVGGGRRQLAIPHGTTTKARANWLKNGTKAAIQFCHDGEYAVFPNRGAAKSLSVVVPVDMGETTSAPTRELTVERDGDLYVFDLAELLGQ